MPAFPRKELEEMVERWLEANRQAEKEGDWKPLSDFYTQDAVYSWNMGPNQEFHAQGRQEIRDIALGYHMEGFEDWKYPYHDVIIDEKRGIVIAFWHQQAPATRDTSPLQVDGISGSWFEYAGNYQWRWQRDFFDLGNVKSLMFEMAGAGKLNATIKQKIREQAQGRLLPGTQRIRPEPSVCAKVQNFLAMIKIVLIGR